MNLIIVFYFLKYFNYTFKLTLLVLSVNIIQNIM